MSTISNSRVVLLCCASAIASSAVTGALVYHYREVEVLIPDPKTLAGACVIALKIHEKLPEGHIMIDPNLFFKQR